MPSPAEFVETVVRSLVDNPDVVQARWVEDPDGGFVEVTTAPDDRGKVIGRRGRTIDSLRILATAAFGNEGRIGVEVAE
jgi:uncharacterized protein